MTVRDAQMTRRIVQYNGTESLFGSVPATMTLEEAREERPDRL